MRLITALLTALLILSCSRHPHNSGTHSVTLSELAATYAALQHTVSDERGWTNTDGCDALLFNSLRAASGVPVDVGAAEDPNRGGKWYRRPADLPECFASGESRSSISRDMLLGLTWWIWTHDRVEELERLWKFGQARNWVMGDGRLGGVDTVLNVNLLSLLARTCHKLGASCPGAHVWRHAPLTYHGGAEGYERHLEVLQILLLAELDGSIPSYLLDRLQRHRAEQPTNPLFAAAVSLFAPPSAVDGPMPTLENLLERYPSDRLPTTDDWCSPWPVERDAGDSSLEPCPERGRIHSGGEVLFIRRILIGKP